MGQLLSQIYQHRKGKIAGSFRGTQQGWVDLAGPQIIFVYGLCLQ